MNQQQKRYAIKRVDNIIEDRIHELKKQCLPDDPIKVSAVQALKLIKSGKVKLSANGRKCLSIAHGPNITYLFDFSVLKGFKPDETIYISNTHGYGRTKYDLKKYNKIIKAYKKKANAIKDKIMLSNSADVLDLIKKLESL